MIVEYMDVEFNGKKMRGAVFGFKEINAPAGEQAEEVVMAEEGILGSALKEAIDEAVEETIGELKPVEQKPSIGRIVLYKHPGSADGRYPAQFSPAIVQKVHDDGTSVDLWVFGPKGLHRDGPYKKGDGPCEWSWPSRV